MNLFKTLLFVILFLFTYQKVQSNIDIEARYAILQDFYSGEILFEKDADESIYPASMTKIMTAIVAFDLLKNGETS